MYSDVLAPTDPVVTESSEVRLAWTSPDRAFFWRIIDLLERIASFVALLFLSPLWITAAIALHLLSGESPFVAVLRSGQFGAPLWVLKLRTMWPEKKVAPSRFRLIEHVIDEEGPVGKNDGDIRVTNSFARFCRRFSLDEIPQLFQVVTGEMSLVAPRPLTSSELREHYGEDASEVLSVRPGVTGLWQVSGRNSLSYPERRTLDILLVRSLTLRLYLRILVTTVPVVFTGKSSW